MKSKLKLILPLALLILGGTYKFVLAEEKRDSPFIRLLLDRTRPRGGATLGAVCAGIKAMRAAEAFERCQYTPSGASFPTPSSRLSSRD